MCSPKKTAVSILFYLLRLIKDIAFLRLVNIKKYVIKTLASF